MKKTISALILLALALCLLSACGKTNEPALASGGDAQTKETTDTAAPAAEPQTADAEPTAEPQTMDADLIPTEEFFTRNSREALMENHTAYLVTLQMTALEDPAVFYVEGDLLADSQPSYASSRLGSAYLTYTDETASEIKFNFVLFMAEGTMKITETYGELLDSPEAELTACIKTDTGYDAEMVTHHDGVVTYSSYCCDRDRAEGDYVRYDMKLNENYEILYVGSYYVPADGSEPLLFKTEEVEFEPETVPDFVENVKASVSGERHILTMVGDNGTTVQMWIYGSPVMLNTDCRVYTDIDCTEEMVPDETTNYSVFNFDMTEDLMLFLKAPAAAE